MSHEPGNLSNVKVNQDTPLNGKFDELRGALLQNRKYFEKYVRVFDLLEHPPLRNVIPAADCSAVFSYEKDDKTTDAAHRFVDSFLNSQDKCKWEAFVDAIRSPGQELLHAILYEASDRELGRNEQRIELVQTEFRRELSDSIQADEFLNRFAFSTHDRERIKCSLENHGNQAANAMILKHIVRYKGWYDKFLNILEDLELVRLAEEIRKRESTATSHQRTYTPPRDCPAGNTRSRNSKLAPFIDDIDKVQRIKTMTHPRDTTSNVGTPTDSTSTEGAMAGGASSTGFGFQGNGPQHCSRSCSATGLNGKRGEIGFHSASCGEELPPDGNKYVWNPHGQLGSQSEPGSGDSFPLPYSPRVEKDVLLKSPHGGRGDHPEKTAPSRRVPQPDGNDEASAIGFHAILVERNSEKQQRKAQQSPAHENLPLGEASGDASPTQSNDVSHASQTARLQRERLEPNTKQTPTCSGEFWCPKCSKLLSTDEVLSRHNCSAPVTPPPPHPQAFETAPRRAKSDEKELPKSVASAGASQHEEQETRETPHCRVMVYRCQKCTVPFSTSGDLADHNCTPRIYTPSVKQAKTHSPLQLKTGQERDQDLSRTPHRWEIFRCQRCYVPFSTADALAKHNCGSLITTPNADQASTHTPLQPQPKTRATKTQPKQNQPVRAEKHQRPPLRETFRCSRCHVPFPTAENFAKHTCQAPDSNNKASGPSSTQENLQTQSHKKNPSGAPGVESSPQQKPLRGCEQSPARREIFRCLSCFATFQTAGDRENHRCAFPATIPSHVNTSPNCSKSKSIQTAPMRCSSHKSTTHHAVSSASEGLPETFRCLDCLVPFPTKAVRQYHSCPSKPHDISPSTNYKGLRALPGASGRTKKPPTFRCPKCLAVFETDTARCSHRC